MISVVLPVYNGETYLPASIDSIINQTYKNWELIIVDDASTDNTKNIINKYVTLDERIKVVHHECNQNLPKSLNDGFAQAKGKYFTWTSDDNIYMENAFEKMYEVLENNTAYDMVYSNMFIIDENTDVIGEHIGFMEDLFFYSVVGACFLYTKEAADKTGKYDSDMFSLEDYDYWLRLSKNHNIYHLKEKLYYYRHHENRLTERKQNEITAQYNKIRIRDKKYILSKMDNRMKARFFLSNYLLIQNQKEFNNLFNNLFDSHLPNELIFLHNNRLLDNKKKIILFGAGVYGKRALNFFGEDKVECFVDNFKEKHGKILYGKKVISFSEYLDIQHGYNTVISVAGYKSYTLWEQLYQHGIDNGLFYQEIVNDFKDVF